MPGFDASRPAIALAAACCAVGLAVAPGAAAASSPADRADARLDRALRAFVRAEDGPPGIAVVVQRGPDDAFHRAGTAVEGSDTPIDAGDHMRLASVAKAFSGAVALNLVASGDLSLDDTIGRRLPNLPAAWSAITLRQLLQHTSGIPDFSKVPAFRQAVAASLQIPPPHVELLSFVAGEPLEFEPGTRYHYSNSDNIVVALMVEAATGRSYADVLHDRVLAPAGLTDTSLPEGASMPDPYVHGYDVELDPPHVAEDVTTLFAAGWTWASGGVVSTPSDANRFVRAYASGSLTDATTRAAQRRFVTGGSEPPGPGRNSAGLAIFRYRTRCGTVYGHTGNTPGYTQFIAATSDGTRSVTVSVNSQVTPTSNPARFRQLRTIYVLGVCAALAAT